MGGSGLEYAGIDFYLAVGAEFMDEWRTVRVNGEALEVLAVRAGGACAP